MKVKYGGSREDKEDDGGRGEEEKCLRAEHGCLGRESRERLAAGREALGLYMKLAAQLCVQTLWRIGACGLTLPVHGRVSAHVHVCRYISGVCVT